jgi:hypothetical protein
MAKPIKNNATLAFWSEETFLQNELLGSKARIDHCPV